MEPIMEMILETIRERGDFENREQIMEFFNQLEDEANNDDIMSLYDEFVGPAIDGIEDRLKEVRDYKELHP